MRVVVAGATGLIGTRLVEALSRRGDTVTVLTRGTSSTSARRLASLPGVSAVNWSGRVESTSTAHDWHAAIDAADAVVNLAGESVAGGRWTEDRKRRILESRLQSTAAVVQALHAATARPRVLVNASAVGFYGDTGAAEVDESSGPAQDFLARVCVDWEAEARRAESADTRVVLARIGIVVAREGGALDAMLPLFRAGLGGRLGSGRQWMSWVHIDDVVGELLWMIDTPVVSGPVNVTAPRPVTNADWTRTLGHVLRRPTVLPAPALALKLALGEFADALLEGQRVIPRRALQGGYRFRFDDLENALANVLR